jgi:hypothetical protein
MFRGPPFSQEPVGSVPCSHLHERKQKRVAAQARLPLPRGKVEVRVCRFGVTDLNIPS